MNLRRRLIIFFPLVWAATLSAQTNAPKKDSIAKGQYKGYSTWQEYLAHQDSVSETVPPKVDLLWVELSIGISSMAIKANYPWTVGASIHYEHENAVYGVRFLEDHDYNSSDNKPSSAWEAGALMGLGAYSRFVLVSVAAGIGLLHQFHYLGRQPMVLSHQA